MGYAEALAQPQFPNNLTAWDTRLFPGLPFLIFLLNFVTSNSIISGCLVTLTCLSLIFWIAYLFCKNPLYSFWLTLFPPIILEQTSKVSTESVLIAVLFMAYYYFNKKKFILVSLILGFAFIVRPVALCFFIPVIYILLKQKNYKKILLSLLCFSLFPILLFIFNFHFWPQDFLFRQFLSYPKVVTNNWVIIQVISDLRRTLDWHQYRIFISGSLYLLFSFYLFIIMVKNKNLLLKIWSILTFLFIFSLGPIPVLEDTRRYLAVFFPLTLLANYPLFLKNKLFFYASFLLGISAFI